MGTSVVLVLGSMAFSPGAEPADAVKAELKKLQGTWNLVAIVQEGQERQGAGSLWVFDGNRALAHHKGRPMNIAQKDWVYTPEPKYHQLTYHFSFDPAKSPKTFDVETQYRHEKGPNKATHAIGIYKLDGDTLTLCYSGYYDKGKRPGEFAAPKGSARQMYILKRVK